MRKKKKKLKSLSSIKKKAWAIFSQYIRQSSADNRGYCTCYTCGNSANWKEMQAGHGIGGRTNTVLFDEEILRTQCVSCNIFKNGNYTIFTTKLIKEHGMEWWDNKLTNSRIPVKYTRSDLEEIISDYKRKLEN
jgi:hypothetical protein